MSPTASTGGGGTTIEVEFIPGELDRLNDVADDAATLVHDAAMRRVDLAEAIAYTEAGEFAGPDGFAKLAGEDTATWPYGALAGLETISIEEGNSHWTMDVGPEHSNPMGSPSPPSRTSTPDS